MEYISICSGIEGASVAWDPLGWKPVAFAEIEAFPRAVLKHRFPEVPLFDDFTQLRHNPIIARADLLVGGTPCQSFSVVGLRNSLDDDRGNLTLEYVRLINAIDDLRRDAGKPPAYALWENVPGVFSTHDNAFGAFLGALVGSDAAVVPPRDGGWESAGVVAGPRRVAAWRVLDAQFFGLAQRRRRVFVLARGNPRGWKCADALLPIIESLSGHPAPRRASGQRIAAALGASPASSSSPNVGSGQGDVVAGTLTARGVNSLGAPEVDGNQFIPCEVAPTLSARTQGGGGLGTDFEVGGGQVAVAFPISGDALRGDGIAQTPSADAEGRVRLRDPGLGIGEAGDPAATIAASGPGAVAIDYQNAALGGDLAGTLEAAQAKGNRGQGVLGSSAVRRLTPRECERLQGFPDDWTLVPFRGKPAADGPRYKALGNSFAVNVVRYIGERIQSVEEQE